MDKKLTNVEELMRCIRYIEAIIQCMDIEGCLLYLGRGKPLEGSGKNLMDKYLKHLAETAEEARTFNK